MFKRKDTYIEGKRMTADLSLTDHFGLGDAVYFNAHVTPASGGPSAGNCAHVWRGRPPAFLEKIIVAKMAELTEGKENPGDTKVWRKVKGKISSVVTKKSGYIRIKMMDKKVEAFFSVENYPPFQGMLGL